MLIEQKLVNHKILPWTWSGIIIRESRGRGRGRGREVEVER